MSDDVFERKGSPYWQCWCRVIDATGHRKRIARSTGIKVDGTAKSRHTARINAQELQRALAVRGEAVTRPKRTIEQALHALTEAAEIAGRSRHTIDNIMYRGATLAKFFQAKNLHDIDADALREYAAWSLKERGGYTVHRELVVLWSAFGISEIKRPTFPDLGDKSRVHKPQRVLELDEQRAFLLAIPVERRLNVCAFLKLGLRLSEPWKIAQSDWYADRILKVLGSKRKKDRLNPVPRNVPISSEMMEMLAPRRHIWPVFPEWHRHCVDFVIRRAGRRSEICDDLSANDLRGTFATHMARSGVDMLTLAGIMGNSPAMLASVYAQVNLVGDHLHQAIEGGVPRTSKPSGSRFSNSKDTTADCFKGATDSLAMLEQAEGSGSKLP
jgi:integrase